MAGQCAKGGDSVTPGRNDSTRQYRVVVKETTTHTVIVRAATAAEARAKAKADDVADDWLDHSRAKPIVVLSVRLDRDV